MFLLSHRHEPAECGWVFASWHGFDSPLRHHGLWWFVDAPDERAALRRLPECLLRQTEVTRVSWFPIP